MAIVFWAVTLLAVLGIALASVKVASDRLAMRPRSSVYDLGEAVMFVAERLPGDVTARLSYEEVEAVLGARLDLLAMAGVAVHVGGAVPEGPDRRVVDESETVARILGMLDADADADADGDGDGDAESSGMTDADVALILAVEADYVRAIGAIGPVAEV